MPLLLLLLLLPPPSFAAGCGSRTSEEFDVVRPRRVSERGVELCVAVCGGEKSARCKEHMNMCYSVYKSAEQGLNLSGSRYKDISHAYNTPFPI